MYNISGIGLEDDNMAQRIKEEDALTAAGFSSDAYDEHLRKNMIKKLDTKNRTDVKVIYELTGRKLKGYKQQNHLMDSRSPDNVRSPDDYAKSPENKRK
jgi:hypothetical protein